MKMLRQILYIVYLLVFTLQIAGQSTTQDYFRRGEFDKIVFDETASLEDMILMSQALLEQQQVEAAKEAIKKMLIRYPGYQMRDTDGPRLWRALVQLSRIEGSKTSVYSVSKSNQDLVDAPATIIVITAEQIKQRGYNDLEQLLNDLPGFDISTGRGAAYTNIYQRGYRGNVTEHLLMLVDGVEMNGLSSHNAFISRQYPLTNIKQIEVVYGPMSNIYGANAFSGVINMITYTGDEFARTDQLRVKGSVMGGRWDTQVADLSMGISKKNFSWIGSGRFFRSDELPLDDFDGWKYSADTADYNRFILNPGNSDYNAVLNHPNFQRFLALENDTTINGTYEAIQRDSLNTLLNDYGNASINYSVYNRLKFGDFQLGHHYWRKKEGTIGWNNWRRAGTDFNNYWIVDNSSIYLQYLKSFLDDRLHVTLFSRFKSHKIHEDTRTVQVRRYEDGSLNIFNLLKEHRGIQKKPPTYFYRSSKQLRSEARFQYNLNKDVNEEANFTRSIMLGTELRNSLIQGDYTNDIIPITSEIDPRLFNNSIRASKQGNFFNYQEFGLFFNFNYQLDDQWTFVGGGRYDYGQPGLDPQNEYRVFNPRAAMIYKLNTMSPDEDLAFKLIWANAFKDASPFNRYSETSSRRVNELGLKPERITNLELSLSGRNWQGIDFHLSAYRSWIQRVISLIEIQEKPRIEENQNSEPSNVVGLEGYATKSWNNGFSGDLNLTLLQPDIIIRKDTATRSRVRVGDMSNWQANIGINYLWNNNALFDLNANARLILVGDRRTGPQTSVPDHPAADPANPNKTVIIDGYQLLNLTINIDNLKNHPLSYQFVLRNVLDHEYVHPGVRTANAPTWASELPQPGINWMFRVTYDFGRKL